MTMEKVYPFDTLPVHPQPKFLESLTGYLTRLAEANGLRYLSHLFKLCFPTEPARLTSSSGDFPPRSFGTLPTLGQCSVATLRATTLYHVGKKFDRLLEPQPLALFLSGSIAPHLRYCPLCLVERGYYSLVWRFLALEGCPEHGCQLLDRCGHCGQVVPLLAAVPKLNLCPTCKGDLRHCHPERLPETKLDFIQARFCDLVYLISPQPYEMTAEKMTGLIGERFAQWRQLRQLKLSAIAQALELSPAVLYYIEAGPEHRGIKFQWYVEYADFLRVSLRDIFETTSPDRPDQSYEEKLMTKVRQAIAILEQRGEPVTQQSVGQMIGIGYRPFTRYAQLRTMWAEYRASWRQQHEDELADNVQQALARLKQAGQGVSLAAVCQQVGLSKAMLRKHPQAWAVWAMYRNATTSVGSRPTPPKGGYSQTGPLYQRQDELVKQVQQAINSLKQQGKPLSQKAIGRVVGLSPTGMQYYPQVKAILQVNKVKPTRQDEEVLLGKIQAALHSLEVAGAMVTTKAVSRLIGLSPQTLKYYPQVRAFVTTQITKKYQEHLARQRQRREEELVLKVQQAIDLLSAGGEHLTQKSVCETVRMSSVNLKRYPRVKLLLQQAGLTKVQA